MKKSAGEPVYPKSFFDNYKALRQAARSTKIASFLGTLGRKLPALFKRPKVSYHKKLATLPPKTFYKILESKNLDLLVIKGRCLNADELDKLNAALASTFNNILDEACDLHNTPAWDHWLKGFSKSEKYAVFCGLIDFHKSEEIKLYFQQKFDTLTEDEINRFRSTLKTRRQWQQT